MSTDAQKQYWREYHSRPENKERKKLQSQNRTALQRRMSYIRCKFKMELEEYEQLLKEQNYICAICKQSETSKNRAGEIKPLAIDHCHNTGQNRGLLCQYCNMGLGSFRDNVGYLESAIEYVKKHSG